ncbi:MAG: hypothetical protein ACO1SX_07425 [Actinomycetota bacterium]
MVLIGKVVLLLVVALGLPLLIWWLVQQNVARVDNGGPLTWSFAASSVPIAAAMYLLSRRAGRRRRVALSAVVVFLPLAGVCVAALIAGLSGVLVSLTATNLPMLGASAGCQFGYLSGSLRRRRRP